MRQPIRWPAGPSGLARPAAALAFSLALCGCDALAAFLSARPPAHPWAAIVEERDGFRIQTRQGVAFYRLRWSDLIDLDGRPPGSYSEGEKRDHLAAARAVCQTFGRLDDTSGEVHEDRLLAFEGLRVSLPYVVRSPYSREVPPGFAEPPADRLEITAFPARANAAPFDISRLADGQVVATARAKPDPPAPSVPGLLPPAGGRRVRSAGSAALVDPPPRSLAAARQVAGEYFPVSLAADLLAFERVDLRSTPDASVDFVWRIKDSASPYFVTPDGRALRATAGYPLVPGSFVLPRYQWTVVEALRSRETAALEPRLVPSPGEAAPAVAKLGDLSKGALGLDWGMVEASLAASLPDSAPVSLDRVEGAATPEARTFASLGDLLISDLPNMTVRKASPGYAFFSSGRLAGIARDISEDDFEACFAWMPRRARAVYTGKIRAPLTVAGGGRTAALWEVEGSMVGLFKQGPSSQSLVIRDGMIPFSRYIWPDPHER